MQLDPQTRQSDRQIDVLVISELSFYPFDQGSKLHGSQMARALDEIGVNVRLAGLQPTPGDCPAWLKKMLVDWPRASSADERRFTVGFGGLLGPLRRRLASHQNLDLQELAGLVTLVDRLNPAAVIALGQHGPVLLHGLKRSHPDIRRVWYAADEPIYFQLSCLPYLPLRQWPHRFRLIGLYAMLEWLFVRGVDGGIGVSPRDTRLLKWLAGVRQTRTVRNGVDLDYYHRHEELDSSSCRSKDHSLVFWGRLDFEPNVDAMCWFARRLWPKVRLHWPDATWRIVGKNADVRVRRLADLPGVTVVGAVPDIRTEAWSNSITILPLRCGAGIKNKLLEASAMSRPILASPHAVSGLDLPVGSRPLMICRSPVEWLEQLRRLWNDPQAREQLGGSARQWVESSHTWRGSARELLRFLNRLLPAARLILIDPSDDQIRDEKKPTLDHGRLSRYQAA